jgi:hypothetical protein
MQHLKNAKAGKRVLLAAKSNANQANPRRIA